MPEECCCGTRDGRAMRNECFCRPASWLQRRREALWTGLPKSDAVLHLSLDRLEVIAWRMDGA